MKRNSRLTSNSTKTTKGTNQMAFQNKNLSVIAYANGFTLWHYAASETLATISTSGYFNSVKTLMNTGDIIIINGSDNTSIKKISVDSTNVSVAALS